MDDVEHCVVHNLWPVALAIVAVGLYEATRLLLIAGVYCTKLPKHIFDEAICILLRIGLWLWQLDKFFEDRHWYATSNAVWAFHVKYIYVVYTVDTFVEFRTLLFFMISKPCGDRCK